MNVRWKRCLNVVLVVGVASGVAIALHPGVAAAQGEVPEAAPPPELPDEAPAEPVADAPVDAEPEPEEKKPEYDWLLSFGGSVNTGNTEAWTLSAGTDFKLVQNSHQLTFDALFSFGRANPPDPALGYTTNVKKFLFNTRYDYFISDMDALWASVGNRWDPLAGFRSQTIAQLGYLRAFVKKENHYFAGRIGYSYTYETYIAPPSIFVGDSNIHGLILALDYENKLNEHVTLLSSIATIYNLNKIAVQNASAFQDIRIYYNLALLAQASDRVAFEVRFLLLYDRIPPTTKKTDTTTLFSLVFTLS